MGDLADKIMAWAQTAVPAAMQKVGDEYLEATRKTISEPFPPASAPFTPPHLRKGLLHDGMHRDRDAEASAVTDTFVSARAAEPGHVGVPEMLESGTPKMEPRPHMGQLRERVIGEYLGDVSAELKAQLAK